MYFTYLTRADYHQWPLQHMYLPSRKMLMKLNSWLSDKMCEILYVSCFMIIAPKNISLHSYH
jgi:hypothetical protein